MATEIIPCVRCARPLRVPSDRGTLHVRCHSCGHAWDWQPAARPSGWFLQRNVLLFFGAISLGGVGVLLLNSLIPDRHTAPAVRDDRPQQTEANRAPQPNPPVLPNLPERPKVMADGWYAGGQRAAERVLQMEHEQTMKSLTREKEPRPADRLLEAETLGLLRASLNTSACVRLSEEGTRVEEAYVVIALKAQSEPAMSGHVVRVLRFRTPAEVKDREGVLSFRDACTEHYAYRRPPQGFEMFSPNADKWLKEAREPQRIDHHLGEEEHHRLRWQTLHLRIGPSDLVAQIRADQQELSWDSSTANDYNLLDLRFVGREAPSWARIEQRRKGLDDHKGIR